MPQNSPRVAMTLCPHYDLERIQDALIQILTPWGGIERWVKPGYRVLLKPNLLAAHPPEKAVTTHPVFVEAVARLVQKAGGEVWIGDSPAGNIHGIRRFWRISGLLEVANRVGARLVSFETGPYFEERKNGRRYFFPKILREVDVLINLPKFKTHNLVLFTGAVKNMYGILPGLQKRDFHRVAPHPVRFSEIILDVFQLVAPTLSLMDAIVGMEGNGPAAGKARQVGLLLASPDAVALDTVASFLMGFQPEKTPTLAEARKRGLGSARIEDISVAGPDLTSLRIPDFKLPSNKIMSTIPEPILKWAGKFLWSRPVADPAKCTGCGICVSNCPVQAMRLANRVAVIDYKKCINCLCCDEVCPENAMKIEQSWLAARL